MGLLLVIGFCTFFSFSFLFLCSHFLAICTGVYSVFCSFLLPLKSVCHLMSHIMFFLVSFMSYVLIKWSRRNIGWSIGISRNRRADHFPSSSHIMRISHYIIRIVIVIIIQHGYFFHLGWELACTHL